MGVRAVAGGVDGAVRRTERRPAPVGGREVAEERLAGLFDLFAQREESRRGVTPELGLSLFTARRLIELHGGTVQATNVEPARGLLTTVRLPLAPDIAHGAT